LPGYSRTSVGKALDALAARTLLQRSDRKPAAAEIAMESWRNWNPAAGFFHRATRNVPYEANPTRIREFLRWRLDTTPVPPALKRYGGAPSVSLPPPRLSGEFPRVLLARRTWRRFSRTPLRLGDLATLLKLTFGVFGWVDYGELAPGPLKTSPSAGGLHPIEAYVLALRVESLPRGLYHYAPARHRLVRLRAGADLPRVDRYLPTQGYYGKASAIVFLTALFARNEWQYPYPRSYRSVLLEAGHLCQTFCLVATWLSLAPFCTAALADSRIEDDLGIDGIRESVLYVAGVGARPKGVDWAPSPEGEEAPRRRKKREAEASLSRKTTRSRTRIPRGSSTVAARTRNPR
jgi:SagB-type dehydrogenase family enzyme